MDEEKNKDIVEEEAPANIEVDERQLFNPGNDERAEDSIGADSAADPAITWEASEFIHHDKSLSWYLILTGVTLLLSVVLYLTLRDPWSLFVLIVMYITITVYARREPRILNYSVGVNGVTIGKKHFNYSQFHSFSVMQETGVPSVSFTPTQRFMPSVSVYFAPEDAEKIILELSKFLPNEQKDPHGVDRLMLKLRF